MSRQAPLFVFGLLILLGGLCLMYQAGYERGWGDGRKAFAAEIAPDLERIREQMRGTVPLTPLSEVLQDTGQIVTDLAEVMEGD